MADSKKLVKLLPEEYQELEYIQSGLIYLKTGYIDTGLVGTDLYGCEIETCMKVSAITNSNLYYLNGAYESGQTTQTGLIREDTEYVHSVVNMGFNTASYSGSIALNDWHTIYTSDGIQKTDGVIVSNETYGTFNNLYYLLFARTDTDVTLSPPFAMKYFWIKKNGQYIRNFIPAKRKSDNVVGMYDIANDVFYTSENQYAFIGGSDVDYWEHSLRKLATSTDTITTLPADLYADGNNATVGLVGNTVQNGTPTPENPIQPSECGDRTVNLLDKSAFTGVGATIEQIKDGIRITTLSNGYAAVIVLDVLPNTDYSLSYIWKYISGNSANTVRVFAGTGSSTQIAIFAYSNGGTFNTGNNTKINIWFYAAFNATATVEYTKIMLNTGNTALPYEPYGQYKIPISSASTTTPVYLGEVETTRRIKKYEMTGSEDITYQSAYSRFFFTIADAYYSGTPRTTPCVCSHYQSIHDGRSIEDVPDESLYVGALYDVTSFNIKTTAFTDATNFKTYLAQQYAAGTPVTVWYILAEPTTGIVNEPIRKIGDYADSISGITIPTITGKDTFDVLTTLKPSEVNLTYTGWHDATVEEWDGSEWQ